MILPITYEFEKKEIMEAKREAYISGYKQAVKDMQTRLKNLGDGAEMLYTCTTVSNMPMVDITVPKEIADQLSDKEEK